MVTCACGLGAAATLLVANLRPLTLVAVLNLEHAGALESVVPAPSDRLTIDGEAQGHVDLVLPPGMVTPLTVTPVELGGPIVADTSVPGTTSYLLTVDEAALNDFLRRGAFSQPRRYERYRDLHIELVQGGLILHADIDLGLRWQRVGLVLINEGTGSTLTPIGVLLDGEAYLLPEEGGVLPSLLLPGVRRLQRTLRDLTVVGPHPGEARVDAVRFHSDRVEILAQASYSASLSPDTGWVGVEPGVELRQLEVAPDSQRLPERLQIVRLDPTRVRFRVRYNPAEPRRVSAWGNDEDVLLAINGGYFTPPEEGGRTIGLLIADGQRWGTPLSSYAGMFAVTAAEEVSVRWLEQWPYAPDEPLGQALQSFPILVKPGGVMGFPADHGEGSWARRTVVAQDVAGNVLLIIAERGCLSLHELAAFLAGSDLMIDVALNLDGGGSTGMWMVSGDLRVRVDSFSSVPSAIIVGRR